MAPNMAMMQNMMQMAMANPSMMQTPGFQQMLQQMMMTTGQQSPQQQLQPNPMSFGIPQGFSQAYPQAPVPTPPVSAAPPSTAAPESSLKSSSKDHSSIKLSSSRPVDTFAGGGSTAEQIKSLRAEQAKLESRSLTASKRAESASKIASIKASAVSQLETAVDLCILMDVTGSMGGPIQLAKDTMKSVVNQAKDRFEPKLDVRVAFVGYRDFCDQERFVVKDFVSSDRVGEVINTLDGCRASGGGDAPEDVAGGLEKVLNLAWKSNIKMLIHVADAPAHGTEYHDMGEGADTCWTPGKGPDPAEMMTQLAQKRLAYYFFKINNSTDKTFAKLKVAHKNSRRECRSFELREGADAALFKDLVMESIVGSVRDAGVTLSKASSVASSSKSASSSSPKSVTSKALDAGLSSGLFSASYY